MRDILIVVYSINSEGTSDASSSVTTKPEYATTPTALIATAIAPNQISPLLVTTIRNFWTNNRRL